MGSYSAVLQRTLGLCLVTAAVITVSDAVAALRQPASTWPILELRQYTLRPGQRDVLIELFEREFVESQDAVGMRVIGTFRDHDRPDRFVWLRAFADMSTRDAGLRTFYTGPVWKAHGKAANSTMLDATNVLLLHPARADTGFRLNAERPAIGASQGPTSVVVATIYYVEPGRESSVADFFDTTVRPRLQTAGVAVLATFVTETATNTFPQLPVRDDRVVVWFSTYPSLSAYERQMEALRGTADWQDVDRRLRSRLKAPPEILKLEPTPRSLLR